MERWKGGEVEEREGGRRGRWKGGRGGEVEGWEGRGGKHNTVRARGWRICRSRGIIRTSIAFQILRSCFTIGETIVSECVCLFLGVPLIATGYMSSDDFKKMYKQKFKEMEKAYEKQVSESYLCATTSPLTYTLPLQEKMLKQMKSHGQSKKHAVCSACLSSEVTNFHGCVAAVLT